MCFKKLKNMVRDKNTKRVSKIQNDFRNVVLKLKLLLLIIKFLCFALIQYVLLFVE